MDHLFNDHTRSYIAHLRQKYSGKKIGFINGLFDGNFDQKFAYAFEHCDVLLVGLCTGFNGTMKMKNKLRTRLCFLHQSKYVGNVITYSSCVDLLKILQCLRPGIRFLPRGRKRYVGEKMKIPVCFV